MCSAYVVAQGFPPQTLDVLTMLGFVILVGTAVNNPILIVDQALYHMRHEGYAQVPAILESVRNRIRPIFMTTTTTVFGLIPLVLMPGAGSELYRGLGAVVLGGLLASTVVSLVLVPVVLNITMDIRNGLMRLLFGRTEAERIDADEPAAAVATEQTSEVSPAAEAAVVGPEASSATASVHLLDESYDNMSDDTVIPDSHLGDGNGHAHKRHDDPHSRFVG
jgi:predicted RND superfamily exporter protein